LIKQKKYLGLRGSGWGSEENRKTRNEVTQIGFEERSNSTVRKGQLFSKIEWRGFHIHEKPGLNRN